jgi:uncharacterized protein (TIGR02246 family)
MNLEALQRFGADYTAAWSSHDPAQVASFFAEDGSLKVNDAEPAVGRDAIAAVAQGFVTAFPDLVLEMDSIRVVGSTVEYHWTFSGTNTGPDGTGQAVRFSGYEEWTIGGDGLVARSLGHFDEAEYARQLEFGVNGAVVAEVRAREIAFAQTMADRDLAAFESFISPEAVFFAGNTPIRGRDSVVEAWTPFFDGPAAPFSWHPDLVQVLESGALALSSGPVRNPEGEEVGRFNSIWRKDSDGQWRVVFDKGS